MILPGFTTGYIEDFIIGQYSSALIGITGGTPPYILSTSGTLPPGMSVQNVSDPSPYNHSGAWLFGTPTQVDEYTFTIHATDNSATPMTVSRTFTVNISPLALYQLPDATFSAYYEEQIVVLGGEPFYTFEKTYRIQCQSSYRFYLQRTYQSNNYLHSKAWATQQQSHLYH